MDYNNGNNRGGMNIAADRHKKANILCFISLGLYVLPFLVSIVYFVGSSALTKIRDIVGNVSDISTFTYGMSSGADFVYDILFSLSGAASIAAIVIMIIARVKYPESKFAKVLMIVYIAVFALSVLAIVLMILLIVLACTAMVSWMYDLLDSLQGCAYILVKTALMTKL